MTRMLTVLLTISLLPACSFAQSDIFDLWKRAVTTRSANAGSRDLGTDKITAGLKEALTIGTGRAVEFTGHPDGFLKNEAIKILIPEKLRTVGKTMRTVGMGRQVDEFEIAMNRAAEQATPKARQIFVDAVMQMTFADARAILSGSDTAATEYFRSKSSEPLRAAFQPIVHEAMENVGVTRQYNRLMQSAVAASFLGSQNFNLDEYVVGKTMDGLFYVLGQEEIKIRKDPAAQTTALLRQVFGKTMSGK